MKRILRVLLLFAVVTSAPFSVRADRIENGQAADENSRIVASLDADEVAHLMFMREEEKLARDVYLVFAGMYPDTGIFSNIASASEQTHADMIRDKLVDYNLSDPNPDTNLLPDSIGVFTGSEWGAYFTEKFDALTAQGSESRLAALYVGALIEELDMHDIVDCPEVMVDAGYRDPCGLRHTDERALINVYRSLIDGSENHLRAYVEQIETEIGAGNYVAQYLTQEEVDRILGR